MKKNSTPAIGMSFRICLTLLLSGFFMMFSKTSSAHVVVYYNPPCFNQGATVTVQPWITYASVGSYFHWQYRVPGGSWTYLGNGNNTINGRVFSFSNASFAGITDYDANGALLNPALIISNVGTPTNPTASYTIQLDNVELRVLMTDALDPQTHTVNTWGGEEYLNPFDAKYICLRSKPVTESCYTNCTDNRVVVNPVNPTLDTYYGGFEMQPLTSANFFTPNATTGATAANTDLAQWVNGTSLRKYRIMNNPDSMRTSFTAFAPHSGREMMIVDANNSCTNRLWYRTIAVSNVNQFFQGSMTFKAWVTKLDGGADPDIMLEIKGVNDVTSSSYTSLGNVVQSVSGAAGNWIQLSLTVTIPVNEYKKLEISIKSPNGCTTPAKIAIDDLCLLEPVSGILPIVLTPLKGFYSNGVSHLNWSSLQESNCNYFEIQHSNDGVSYSPIGKIIAKGTSDVTVNYSFDDIKAASGINYYRLKLVDKDDRFQNSNIVALNVNIKGINVTGIYPAPFTDKINVTVSSEIKDRAIVSLFDNTGKLLVTQQNTVTKGVNNLSLENLDNLSKGFYIVKIQVGESVIVKKIIK